MFRRLADGVVSARRTVLITALILTIGAAIWGVGVFGKLGSGGFDDPAAESQQAATLIESSLGRSSTDLILAVQSGSQTVADPAFEDAVTGAVADIPADLVVHSTDYWSTGAPQLVADDRHATYVAITLTDVDALQDEADAVAAMRTDLEAAGYQVHLGGPAAANLEINDRVGGDIAFAEMVSMPVLLLLLIVIFGSIVAASLPLVIGALSILGSFASLNLIAQFTDVSVFAINVVTILGLGLAIDYGLLMVGRFREELAAGYDGKEAARRTVRTAGKTVAVSAATVAISLSGLLLFPQTFLRSMGFGGISAVLVAAIAATVVLPALMATVGTRVDRWSVRRSRRSESASGFWSRLAHAVMRRPAAYLVGALLILGLLAAPVLGIRFGGIDERVLPADSDTRVASAYLEDTFGIDSDTPVQVVTTLADPVESSDGQAALTAYADELAALPSVTEVSVARAEGDTAAIDVHYVDGMQDVSTEALVTDIRGLDLPTGISDALVGGQTAMTMDRLASIGEMLPWMALVIVVATFVLLFLAFGSILLPLKAIVLNLITLGATMGVVTWIFQDGNLAGLLGFTSTGFVEATQPILVMAIVFGLSMDYEVFMLSRIREQYDATGDNTTAVAAGLQRTGRIITSAAALILVVIALFSASSISFIKLIGVAMIVAILLDALLVRMIVVPAAMRLMGNANWWLPGPLRRIYDRFGISEEEARAEQAPVRAEVAAPELATVR